MAPEPHFQPHNLVGDEIEVWWPEDKAYYPGVISAILPNKRHRIIYDDGDIEELLLDNEIWRFIHTSAQSVHSVNDNTLPTSELGSSPTPLLPCPLPPDPIQPCVVTPCAAIIPMSSARPPKPPRKHRIAAPQRSKTGEAIVVSNEESPIPEGRPQYSGRRQREAARRARAAIAAGVVHEIESVDNRASFSPTGDSSFAPTKPAKSIQMSVHSQDADPSCPRESLINTASKYRLHPAAVSSFDVMASGTSKKASHAVVSSMSASSSPASETVGSHFGTDISKEGESMSLSCSIADTSVTGSSIMSQQITAPPVKPLFPSLANFPTSTALIGDLNAVATRPLAPAKLRNAVYSSPNPKTTIKKAGTLTKKANRSSMAAVLNTNSRATPSSQRSKRRLPNKNQNPTVSTPAPLHSAPRSTISYVQQLVRMKHSVEGLKNTPKSTTFPVVPLRPQENAMETSLGLNVQLTVSVPKTKSIELPAHKASPPHTLNWKNAPFPRSHNVSMSLNVSTGAHYAFLERPKIDDVWGNQSTADEAPRPSHSNSQQQVSRPGLSEALLFEYDNHHRNRCGGQGINEDSLEVKKRAEEIAERQDDWCTKKYCAERMIRE